MIRFVQIGYGWAITSALCLYQSPTPFKDIHVRSLRAEDIRVLMLISRADVLEELSKNTVGIMRDVYRQLVDGPWSGLSGQCAQMMRAVNPTIFPDSVPR